MAETQLTRLKGLEKKMRRDSGVYDGFLPLSNLLKLTGLIFISANSIECSWPLQWNQLIPCGDKTVVQMVRYVTYYTSTTFPPTKHAHDSSQICRIIKRCNHKILKNTRIYEKECFIGSNRYLFKLLAKMLIIKATIWNKRLNMIHTLL